MNDDTIFRPFHRKKRYWLLAILLLCGLCLIGVWLYQKHSVSRQLADLRAQGLPTSAAEVNDFYRVPEGEADTTELWVDAIDAVVAADVGKSGGEYPFIGADTDPVPPPGQDWDELDACRDYLAGLDDDFTLIRRAAAAGGVARYPTDYSDYLNVDLRQIQQPRTVARLLVLDAHVSAHDGADAQALRDIIDIFALSESLRAEPTPISQLVRIAIHAVGCSTIDDLIPYCEWDEAQMATLQSAVIRADFKAEMQRAIQGERGLSVTSLKVFTLFQLTNTRETLRFYAAATSAFEQPWPELLSRLQNIETEYSQRSSGMISKFTMIGVRLLLPATRQVAEAGARASARQNCTIAAIAAYRYRLQAGELPESLAYLTDFLPSYDPTLTTDPFDGQPLRFKSDDKGIVIYSVGRNQQDDGGAIEENGTGEIADVGVRVGP